MYLTDSAGPNTLYLNEGDGTFSVSPFNSQLDLYVVNWWYEADPGSPLMQDHLYHNNGDGTFSDVTTLLDIATATRPGYAATFVDYDNDGDQDLYVVNDKQAGNVLWRNDGVGCGGWCFADVSVETGADRPVWGMGIAGDYDNDATSISISRASPRWSCCRIKRARVTRSFWTCRCPRESLSMPLAGAPSSSTSTTTAGQTCTSPRTNWNRRRRIGSIAT